MEKIHVLLVEDEQTLAMIIKDTLEEQDFIITTAGDGEEGLRKFFEQKPDVLVADVMMPRMDGFEMVRRIRQSDKPTPVLFLTARSPDKIKGNHQYISAHGGFLVNLNHSWEIYCYYIYHPGFCGNNCGFL